jgi:MoxR-like ATPase
LIRSSRIDDRIRLGASPRALLSLTRCAQAAAWLDDRDFVTPDDIREMAVPVLAHRLVLENKTEFAGVSRQAIVSDLVKQIKAPV